LTTSQVDLDVAALAFGGQDSAKLADVLTGSDSDLDVVKIHRRFRINFFRNVLPVFIRQSRKHLSGYLLDDGLSALSFCFRCFIGIGYTTGQPAAFLFHRGALDEQAHINPLNPARLSCGQAGRSVASNFVG